MGERRVAVVGTGVAGLAALKACLEEGLHTVCFEQHGDIGGIWYMTDEFREGQNARIYDSLILNTSKGMVCYSDFPFPTESPPYPSGKDMHAYLRSYAEHFGLLKYIQFNTKVHYVKRNQNFEETGRWDVETEVNENRTWRTFDAVLVCSGFYTKPHVPPILGLESFKGTVKHSQTFKNGSEYRDNRILVVGNSNSAGDVAVDISRYAEQVYLSVGKGTWIIPRLQENGLPLDFLLKRMYVNLGIPESFVARVMVKKANSRLDHHATGLSATQLPPKGAVMVNDDIQMRIQCGAVKIVGNVARFGEKHAEFVDGAIVSDLDGVVFATGLQREIPFLDPIVKSNEEILEWYKMVFPVQLLPHNSLAVIGYFRTQGSVVPISELQARLAARVIAHRHTLPPVDVMRKDINKWNNYMMKTFGAYKYSFPNVPFRDELAEEIGVKPTLKQLLKFGPRFLYDYFLGPAFTFHHRLTGPGCWSGAVDACAQAKYGSYACPIRKLPKTKATDNYMKTIVVMTVLSVLLYLCS